MHYPLECISTSLFGGIRVHIEPWADIVRDVIFADRKGVDEILYAESESRFSSDEWMRIMESDGVHFEGCKRVEWAMATIL